MSYYHSNQYQYGAPNDYISPQHLMDAMQISSNMPQEQSFYPPDSAYQYGAPNHYTQPQSSMNVPPTQFSSNFTQEQSSYSSDSVYQYGATDHYAPPQSLMNVPPMQMSSNIPQEQSSQSSGSLNQYGAPNHYISPQSLMNVPPKQGSSNKPQKQSPHPPSSVRIPRFYPSPRPHIRFLIELTFQTHRRRWLPCPWSQAPIISRARPHRAIYTRWELQCSIGERRDRHGLLRSPTPRTHRQSFPAAHRLQR